MLSPKVYISSTKHTSAEASLNTLEAMVLFPYQLFKSLKK